MHLYTTHKHVHTTTTYKQTRTHAVTLYSHMEQGGLKSDTLSGRPVPIYNIRTPRESYVAVSKNTFVSMAMA